MGRGVAPSGAAAAGGWGRGAPLVHRGVGCTLKGRGCSRWARTWHLLVHEGSRSDAIQPSALKLLRRPPPCHLSCAARPVDAAWASAGTFRRRCHTGKFAGQGLLLVSAAGRPGAAQAARLCGRTGGGARHARAGGAVPTPAAAAARRVWRRHRGPGDRDTCTATGAATPAAPTAAHASPTAAHATPTAAHATPTAAHATPTAAPSATAGAAAPATPPA
eukprot:365471-Chlamydomonas_euryale.AAC.2